MLEKRETLKQLLGISGEEKDPVLQFVLCEVEEKIKNYCNLDEVPQELAYTAVSMAADIYRNEQFGNDSVPVAVKSISAGDTSTSFGTVQLSSYTESVLKDYKKQLNRYRKVGF